jgi:hypothetical protein
MKLFITTFILTINVITSISAQKQVTDERQIWLASFNQARLSNKWGLWGDFHFRMKDNFVGEPSIGIARVGLMYYLTDDARLTAGYSYINHFPAEGHKEISQPEHRPWQQIQWFTRSEKTRLMQWIRLEQRYRRKILNDETLADGYNFNWRIRYNFALFLPLTKKRFEPGGLQFLINDEIHFNFGKNITFNYFDQNRLFGGLVYQTSSHSQLHFGYMNVFQQLASGNRFRNIHAIRLFYFHNFDWRK